MSSVNNFKDLEVWKQSKDLAINIYKLTEKLPQSETFGLGSQMQRAAVSIPSNIAEGFRRNGKKEFSHFISMSIGSAAELETQLYICSEVYEIDTTNLVDESIKIQKMLFGLKKQSKITEIVTVDYLISPTTYYKLLTYRSYL